MNKFNFDYKYIFGEDQFEGSCTRYGRNIIIFISIEYSVFPF